MHGCDVMLNVGARFDDRVTGRLNAFSPDSQQDPHRHRSLHHQQERPGGHPHHRRRRRVLSALIAAWQADDAVQRRAGARRLVAADRGMARPRLPELQPGHERGAIIKPQYAIQRLYELTREPAARHLHHHRGRPAPDVGGAVFPVRQAEPLDDQRRPRHHGLRPAGGHGRADRASRRAGDRHRRRGQHPDEHPGDGDAGAVSPAGEGVHPEQPVHGHGAPVAGAAARRPLFRELLRGAARFRASSPKPSTRSACAPTASISSTTSSATCWNAHGGDRRHLPSTRRRTCSR